MAKRDSSKKHAKRIARKERVAAKQRRFEELKERHQFPEFVFEPNDAPPEFVAAVQEAVQSIDFRDRAVFYDWETQLYRRMKDVGAERALGEFIQRIPPAQNRTVVEAHFSNNLGEAILTRIPERTLLRFIPYHDFFCVSQARQLRVLFRSLKQAKGPNGTIYYSRHEPKLRVAGQDLVVAFSGHAIDRTRERNCKRWPSYAALGDVFAFFDECLHFELCELHRGQLAFTFFELCEPGFAQETIAQAVLEDRFLPGKSYSIRVGYCPAVVEGRFFKAKTLLVPGFDETPEYGKIVKSGLPRAEKQAMIQLVGELKGARLLEEDALALLKWFHDQGVEQVRLGRVAYAHPGAPPKP